MSTQAADRVTLAGHGDQVDQGARRPSWSWSPLLVGVLPAIAGAATAVLYDDPLLLLLMLLAAAAAGAIPVILTLRSPGLAGPAALLVLVALFVLLASVAGGGSGPGALLSGMAAAVPRMLSFAPPIPTRLETVAPVLAVVWAASFAAASVRVRGRRLAATGPSIVVLVAALLLVGRAATVPGWVAPLLGFGVLAVLFEGRPTPNGRQTTSSRATRSTRRVQTGVDRGRAVALGLVVAIALIGAGLAVSQATPLGDRVDVRTRYQPPLEQPEPIDPLTRLAGWAKGDQQLLATVRVDQAPANASVAWRWAILDQFDGARWTSSLRYRPTGQRPRGEPRTGAPTGVVRAAVATSPVLDPWLPTPGTIRALSAPGLAVSGDGESLMGRNASNGSISYGIVADTNLLDGSKDADRGAIASLSAAAPDGAETLAVPQLPDELRRVAQAVANRAGPSDGERALVLQELLHDGGQFVTDAPPGHLYLRLVQFLTDPDLDVRLKGTSEQFATTFAVLARALGLPTRVVVGFTIPATSSDRDQPVAADRMQAWPEVYFAGPGWVRFVPTPDERGAATSRPSRTLDDILDPDQQSAAQVTSAPVNATDGGPRKPPQPDQSGASMVPIVATVLVGVLVMLVLVLCLLRAGQRRARRRHPDPSDCVLGAWLELRDALYLAEADTPPQAVSAVTRQLSSRLGADAASDAQPLAQAANAAAFAPGGSLGVDDAERAWAVSDQLVARLRRSSSRPRRWTWWFNPTPLRRQR